MQKTAQSTYIKYSSLCLYLDDLEEIKQIFAAHFDDVTITVDEYKVLDLAKLADLNRPYATSLEIEAKPDYGKQNYRKGYMRLRLMPFTRELYLSDRDDVILAGVASQISKLLKKRKSPIGILYNIWWSFLYLFIITLLNVIAFFTSKITEFSTILSIFTLILVITYFIFHRFFMRKNTRIFFYESYKKSNFFVKNKDNLLVNLIASFVGFVLGIIGGIIIAIVAQHFTK